MKCQHIDSLSGKQCGAHSLRQSDDNLCYFHTTDPEVVARRVASQRQGGSKGTTTMIESVANLDDIRLILSDVISQLRSKKKMTRDEVFKLRSVGYVCNVLVKVIDISEIENRIQNLEKNLLPNGSRERW